MDDPARYAPTLHAFEDRPLPFLTLADDLPCLAGFSIDRQSTKFLDHPS